MSAREKILDAAAEVIRDRGLARATTKEIARAAGYSEALLYKHFSDKQAIFMGVLKERVGGLPDPTERAGSGTVHDNLVEIVAGLMRFYVQTFPMAASLFSTPDLLAAWRTGLTAHRGGPRDPVIMVERYLGGEVRLGRVDPGVDVGAVAALLCGAAFQNAFLACFDGRTTVPDATELAQRLVAASGIRPASAAAPA